MKRLSSVKSNAGYYRNDTELLFYAQFVKIDAWPYDGGGRGY